MTADLCRRRLSENSGTLREHIDNKPTKLEEKSEHKFSVAVVAMPDLVTGLDVSNGFSKDLGLLSFHHSK